MVKTVTDRAPETDVERDPVAEFDALRARLHARTPDMTPEDWDALADHWAEEVNARIRAWVERMREEQSA